VILIANERVKNFFFSIYLILPADQALGFTQPLTEISEAEKNVSGE
jgi:hypothetical protein